MKDYYWIDVMWRCTWWQVGYIYVDSCPVIEFLGAIDDSTESPYGADIFDCLTDRAKGEVYKALYEEVEKAKYVY